MILLNSSGLMKPSWSLSKYLNACRRRSPCNPFMSWVNSLSIKKKNENRYAEDGQGNNVQPNTCVPFFFPRYNFIQSLRYGWKIWRKDYISIRNSPVEVEWNGFRSKIGRKDGPELVEVNETRVIASIMEKYNKFIFHYDTTTITHTSKYWKAIQ